MINIEPVKGIWPSNNPGVVQGPMLMFKQTSISCRMVDARLDVSFSEASKAGQAYSDDFCGMIGSVM